jgi:hypothetical protein
MIYHMWYDMYGIWYVIWYMIWYISRYMIWYNMICDKIYHMTWYICQLQLGWHRVAKNFKKRQNVVYLERNLLLLLLICYMFRPFVSIIKETGVRFFYICEVISGLLTCAITRLFTLLFIVSPRALRATKRSLNI